MPSYKMIGPDIIQIRENDVRRIHFKKITEKEKKEIRAEGYNLLPMYFLDEDFVNAQIRENTKII